MKWCSVAAAGPGQFLPIPPKMATEEEEEERAAWRAALVACLEKEGWKKAKEGTSCPAAEGPSFFVKSSGRGMAYFRRGLLRERNPFLSLKWRGFESVAEVSSMTGSNKGRSAGEEEGSSL